MTFFKRTLFMIVGLLMALLMVACGNDATTTSTGGSGGSTPTSVPAATPTTPPTNTPATTGASAVVKTTQLTVGGKTQTVLTTTEGLTLYYLTKDTASNVTCTGACAKNWPPLLYTGSGVPTSATSLPGKLTAFAGPLGSQVEYEGHPLYTFAGDSGPNQANGQGVGNVWYAMTTAPASGY